MEQHIAIGAEEQGLLRGLREAVRASDLPAKEKNFYTLEIRRVLDGANHDAMASVIGLARRFGHDELVEVLEGRLRI